MYYESLYEAGAEVFVLGNSGLFGKSGDTKEAVNIAKKFIIDAIGND